MKGQPPGIAVRLTGAIMGALQGAMLGGQHNMCEPGAAGHDIEMYCYQASITVA